ncbi:MAG TPA: hypothetical protein VK530_08235 [Candidatus Acidoferrum sp.]|nr:hypothetical protein [Candidatus Acidoferrum sp.]
MGIFSPSVRRILRRVVLFAFFLCSLHARAEIIFDVFVGYGLGASDGVVAEASFFPVTVEVQNNGPGFNGVVEIVGGQFGNGQRRLVPLELPSGTKKRFVVPVYCAGKFKTSVDARLRNEKGKIVAEQLNLEPRPTTGHVDSLSPLIASLPRTHSGAAGLPEPARRSTQLSPAATHLNAESFPENPIALDGISTLYLHSSRAPELKVPQVNALLAWLHGGGRLVVGIEQPGDVNATEWLQTILPCQLGEVKTVERHSALQEWLNQLGYTDEVISRSGATTNVFTNLLPDDKFEEAPLQVIAAKLRDGNTIIGNATQPLAISAPRGRGELVVLLFSPELEPFRSWLNRSWFWAKLSHVPITYLASGNISSYPNTSLDGVFGAMVDSRQIRKLPIGWLLLLLIVYLIVIGPLDQYWLKKINKQMLTWITFPAYVAIFSGLIYFIGYTLRSGETEWNELQIVDVIPHGARADLRGRTYGSAYSPVNATYSLASDQPFATLRGEVSASVGEHAERDDAVELVGNSFKAKLSVPVWTSQLYVNDWWRQDNTPMDFTVVADRNGQYTIEIKNPGGKRITQAKVIIDNYVYDVSNFSKPFTITRGSGQPLAAFVQNHQQHFNNAVSARKSQFGSRYGGHLEDVFNSVAAASFLSAVVPDQTQAQQQPFMYSGRFVSPRGFDLMSDVRRESAVLIAYLPDQTFAAPLNKFNPRMSRKNSVVRVITPVKKS